ncbi:MAG: hypothetical protein CSB06_00140 [Bacteroidia bacterium]|nr:MAG: hypothetical protein CSB06_00140 [Bacteroidia bacterium]
MRQSILYKEWLKTRRVFGILWIITLGLLLYMFISLRSVFRMLGMDTVWDFVVNQHHILFSELKYFPLLFGLLPALAQFIPEMQKKRLKLSLHLPLSQRTTYFTMQLYGFGVILLSFLLQLLIVAIFSQIYFAQEITLNALITLLPWYCAGICTYLFTALICLEPSFKRRILYLPVACGTLYFFYLSDFPGAYTRVWWMYPLILTVIFPIPFLSVIRFKKGIQ